MTAPEPPDLPPMNAPWTIPHAWTPPSPLPEAFTSSRLRIRPYRTADAPAMFAAIDASRASLLPWIAWARVDCRDEAECIYNIERFRRAREDAAGSDFSFGVFNKETDELLGGTGIIRVSREMHQGEIGYWVRADRRRQGIATETTAAMLTWGLSPQDRGGWGLRRMVIYVVAENEASRSVPQKLGLRLELAAKADRWQPGMGFVDTMGWGVNLGEWDTENHRIIASPAALEVRKV